MSWHLHPPLLRKLGLRHKIRVGWWFTPAFHALHAARRQRGTGWDPFGYARVRRAERALIDEYRHVVGLFMTRLGTDPVQDCIDIANLPDRVRGYEDVKLDSITAYRAELTARTAALNASPERI